MATRSSGSSNRSKKSPAQPLPPVINLPDESHSDSTDSDSRAASQSPQITKTKLEQREIPSFSESREARIAEQAYWRAERRGFSPGHELEDWLHAEKDVDGDASSK